MYEEQKTENKKVIADFVAEIELSNSFDHHSSSIPNKYFKTLPCGTIVSKNGTLDKIENLAGSMCVLTEDVDFGSDKEEVTKKVNVAYIGNVAVEKISLFKDSDVLSEIDINDEIIEGFSARKVLFTVNIALKKII